MSDLQSVPPPVEDAELERLMDAAKEAFAWEAGVEFYPRKMPLYDAARRKVVAYVAKLAKHHPSRRYVPIDSAIREIPQEND